MIILAGMELSRNIVSIVVLCISLKLSAKHSKNVFIIKH